MFFLLCCYRLEALTECMALLPFLVLHFLGLCEVVCGDGVGGVQLVK